MKPKLTNLTFIIFISINAFSQENGTVILGRILDSNKAIKEVHVINLNSKMGTISTLNGEFEIFVNENDELLFSSIQYNPLKITITKSILSLGEITISLTPIINELDEVFLNGLTGDLNYDLKNSPKDTNPRHNFKIKKNDLLIIQANYPTDFLKEPDARKLTDPTYGSGVGGSATIPNFQLIAEQKLKRELDEKKKFPEKIKREFGLDFFTINLNIPKHKINNFISYCEYRNIMEKYFKNQVFQVIEILKEESKLYNEIKN